MATPNDEIQGNAVSDPAVQAESQVQAPDNPVTGEQAQVASDTTQPDTTAEGQQDIQAEGQDTDEPTEHGDRSRLGRRVAKVEESLKASLDRIDAFLAGMAPRQEAQPQVHEPQVPQFTMPDGMGVDPEGYPLTNKDVVNLIQRTQWAAQNQEQKYWGDYSRTLTGLGNQAKLNPEEVTEIGKLIASGNQKTHADPSVAAQMNFLRAREQFLLNKLKTYQQPRPNVSGQQPISATGVATSQKSDTSKPEAVQLDPLNERVKQALGLTDEFSKNAMKQT